MGPYTMPRDNDVPEWVAPAGSSVSFLLGDRVRFQAILEEHKMPGDEWRGWTRQEIDESEIGLIMGQRFPYSGVHHPARYRPATPISPESHSGGYRTREVVHRTYLVVTNLRKDPYHVLSDDLELVE